MTDPAILTELGERLARYRLDRNLTQADLAKEAGVSKRTVLRLESGESTQLTNLIRIMRALGRLDHLDAFLPPPAPSPLEQLKADKKRRKRASPRTAPRTNPRVDPRAKPPPAKEAWSWGEDDQDGEAR